jgi:hypothetical protein
MFTPTRKYHVLFVALTLAMLALITSACSFYPSRLGDVTQVVDITLDEDLFSQQKPTFTLHGHNFWDGLLDDVTRLEFHDGYMRFIGTRNLPDGSRVDGSLDLSLSAENGALVARVIAVDIPGIELNDPLILEINQDLEADLSSMDFDPHSEVVFKEVKVTEEALQMKIQVTVRF